jgi:hypothetical protein
MTVVVAPTWGKAFGCSHEKAAPQCWSNRFVLRTSLPVRRG